MANAFVDPEGMEEMSKSPRGGSGREGDDPIGGEAGGFTASTAQGMTYIIAIGIDKYGYEGVPDFPFGNCKKDCDDFVAALENTYKHCRLYKDTLTNGDATREKILARISEFRKDKKTCNIPGNSLVLYFSGHGCTYEGGQEGVKKGAWVPHGCKDKEEPDELIRLDNLFNDLSNMQTRNFLLIADCCKSGKIFEEIQPGLRTYNTKTPGGERSSWAIVSSRSDEDSKSGGPGENSKFTAALLDILKGNENPELLLSMVGAKLDQYFAHDTFQKPIWGRLVFADIRNTGNFLFESKMVIDAAGEKNKRREALLTEGLWSLNYGQQEKKWPGFKKEGKKKFALFSGNQNCGLNHLSERARKYPFFPVKDELPLPTSSLIISGKEGDPWIAEIFGHAFGLTFADPAAVRAHILSVKKCLIFGFSFYQEQGAEDELRPADKKKRLDLLANFLNTIRDEDICIRLLVFVIDHGSCDYQRLYPTSDILGISAVIPPVVTPLDYEEAEGWYTRFRNGRVAGGKQQETEFDALLEQVILAKLENMIAETEGFPGSLARKMCREAKCDRLADTLQY